MQVFAITFLHHARPNLSLAPTLSNKHLASATTVDSIRQYHIVIESRSVQQQIRSIRNQVRAVNLDKVILGLRELDHSLHRVAGVERSRHLHVGLLAVTLQLRVHVLSHME